MNLALCLFGGTGVSGLTRGLATLPRRWIQEPSVVRNRDGRPQEDPVAVYCFCVCSGNVQLGDLLGVSRFRERDLLSVLSIYPRILLCVFIVQRRIVRTLCLLLYSAMLMCVCCFWFSCQYLPSDWLYRKTPRMTPSWGEEIISTKPSWKSVFVCIFLLFGLFMLLCVPPPRPYTIYISYAYGTI